MKIKVLHMNRDLFEINMAVLEKRSHFIAEKIRKIEIDGTIMSENAQNGMEILCINDRGRKWCLNSSWNPIAASEFFAKRYSIRLYGVYFVFGFSDGRYIRELLKKCDDTNLLVVCEPNLKIFAKACSQFDLQDLLQEDRIIFYFPELEDKEGAFLQGIIDYTRIKLLEFCILPAYDILYHEECERYMDAVLECMRNATVNKETHFAFDRLLPQHMLWHMKHMIFYSNIQQVKESVLKKDIKNVPAIIVSAGPSLDKNIYLLKKAHGKAFIIAVDASARTTLMAGVRPDLLCSVDPNSPDRFFTGLDLDDIYWAGNNWTNPEILKKYAKHIFYYGYYGNTWNEVLQKELQYPFPNVAPGGSVSTEAFMLALMLGFRTIVLIGQDLAFTGGVSHTKGIGDALGDNDEYIKSRQIIEVEGIDGEILQTDYQMWFYKQWFEKAIRFYKDEVRVIDATEGGARIEGAELCTLEEVIQKECTKEMDMYALEEEVPPMFSEACQKKMLKKLKSMRTDITDFEKMIANAIQEQQKILTEIQKEPQDTARTAIALQNLMGDNKKIESNAMLSYISMYAQKEEYALGDSIYADENLTPVQLVEKSLALLKGYQKGAKLFLEDFDQIIMNDKDPINN